VHVDVVVARTAVAREGETVAGGRPRDARVVADVFGQAREEELGLLTGLRGLVVDRVDDRAVGARDDDLLPVAATALECDELAGTETGTMGVGVVGSSAAAAGATATSAAITTTRARTRRRRAAFMAL